MGAGPDFIILCKRKMSGNLNAAPFIDTLLQTSFCSIGPCFENKTTIPCSGIPGQHPRTAHILNTSWHKTSTRRGMGTNKPGWQLLRWLLQSSWGSLPEPWAWTSQPPTRHDQHRDLRVAERGEYLVELRCPHSKASRVLDVVLMLAVPTPYVTRNQKWSESTPANGIPKL